MIEAKFANWVKKHNVKLTPQNRFMIFENFKNEQLLISSNISTLKINTESVNENNTYVCEICETFFYSIKSFPMYCSKKCAAIAKSRPILQLDLDDNIIKEWSSILEFQKEKGNSYTNLMYTITNRPDSIYKGFKWRFKNDK